MVRLNWHVKFKPSKTTRIALDLLVVLAILSVALLTSSCAHALGKKPPVSAQQPPKEFCILGDQGCICFDPRKPIEEQSYVLSYAECKNYIATNAIDYNAQQEWISVNCNGPKPKQAEAWGAPGSTLGDLK